MKSHRSPDERATRRWVGPVGCVLALAACGPGASPPRDAAAREDTADRTDGAAVTPDDAATPADAFDPFADDASAGLDDARATGDDARCPAGQTEVTRADGRTECARLCGDDAECSGELCEPVDGAAYRVCTENPCGRANYPVFVDGAERCLPLCERDEDCARGACTRLVEAPRSVCVPPAPDAGTPVLCGPGEAVCGGACVALQLDPAHCGACGRACATGETCAAGRCAAPPDPCNGVSEAGRCASATALERCVLPTGGGERALVREACEAGYACSVVEGEAACRLVAECVEETAQCVDANTLRRCVGGRWQSAACTSGCVGGALGASCRDLAIPLREIQGNLTYQYRAPRDDRRDWGELRTAPSPSVDLYVYRGARVLYFSFVNRGEETNNGNFRAMVPVDPVPEDRIVFAAATSPTASAPMQYALLDPMLAAGTHPTSARPTSPRLWTWQARVQTLPANNRLVINETSRSGALHAFASLVRTYEFARRTYGDRYGRTLAVWLNLDVDWSCGACYARAATTALGSSFASQIWLGDNARDQRHWASAVTTHEVGHWIMDSYGVSPGEGGTHYVGIPTYPGQAYSEGFATFVSAQQRNDPVYVDKTGGMFWFDVRARRYGSGRAWQRPVATQPLTQRHDENDVAALLLSLADPTPEPVYRALALPRLAGPMFARGYTRHRWTTTMPGVFTNVVNTGTPAPFFADLLDALTCSSSVPRERIDAVCEPTTRYPYPSSRPLCR